MEEFRVARSVALDPRNRRIEAQDRPERQQYSQHQHGDDQRIERRIALEEALGVFMKHHRDDGDGDEKNSHAQRVARRARHHRQGRLLRHGGCAERRSSEIGLGILIVGWSVPAS